MSATPVPHPGSCPSRLPMALLAEGVPLTLLLDLVLGPRSRELLRAESAEPVPPQGPG